VPCIASGRCTPAGTHVSARFVPGKADSTFPMKVTLGACWLTRLKSRSKHERCSSFELGCCQHLTFVPTLRHSAPLSQASGVSRRDLCSLGGHCVVRQPSRPAPQPFTTTPRRTGGADERKSVCPAPAARAARVPRSGRLPASWSSAAVKSQRLCQITGKNLCQIIRKVTTSARRPPQNSYTFTLSQFSARGACGRNIPRTSP
jgi:hypothetical protein